MTRIKSSNSFEFSSSSPVAYSDITPSANWETTPGKGPKPDQKIIAHQRRAENAATCGVSRSISTVGGCLYFRNVKMIAAISRAFNFLRLNKKNWRYADCSNPLQSNHRASKISSFTMSCTIPTTTALRILDLRLKKRWRNMDDFFFVSFFLFARNQKTTAEQRW